MVIGVFTASGHNRLDSRAVADDTAADLRARYELRADQFTVILIGKDGGVKLREQYPPELDRLH